MGLVETSVVYAILGVVVAAAMLLQEPRAGWVKASGAFVVGAVFWPLFAPSLLARHARTRDAAASTDDGSHVEGRVRSVESRLVVALDELKGGLAEEVLAPEVGRVRALVGALGAMARRLHEIDALLATPEFDEARVRAALEDLAGRGHGGDDPKTVSVRARLRNIDRLRGMRARTSDDLERALLKIEEMTSQVLLLKFADKPDAEAVRLIKDAADSVESITEALLAVA